MNGSGIFNAQILVDKLAKLNNSQQSIETLSHWCIFHMKKAKQVVETWERQFHCSPRDQRLSFLYLANDILQNSRRKGLEFVGEFWKVLPRALHDVVHNGDDFGRKAALRLVDIWEERKVFGSRGQALKEAVVGNRNGNGKNITYKLQLQKPSAGGDMLEKIISGYDQVNDVPIHEDVISGKCTAAMNFIEKLEKESGPEFNLGGPGVLEGLQGHQGFLRESIEQLKLSESSRAILISYLREAIHEQESKMEQIRNQLQITQSRFEQVDQLLTGQPPPPPPPPDQQLHEPSPPPPPPPPPPSFSEVPPPPPPESPTSDTAPSNEKHHKTSAAEEVARSMNGKHLSDSNKRPRLDNGSLIGVPRYMPLLPPPPPPPPFPHPEPLQPLPPPLPHPISPIPPPFPYGSTVPYPMMGMPPFPGPPIPYNFQGSDNVATFFGQLPPPPPPPPMISAQPPMPRK